MRQQNIIVKAVPVFLPSKKHCFFLCCAAFLSIFSCSLNYNAARKAPLAPELVFHGVEFTRIEEGKITARMNASIFENYRADNSLFGSDVIFEVFEENGETSARGSAAFFYADQKNDRHTLLGGANITSFTHDVQIHAENLRWNNKTEQLVAAKNDEVSITRGGFAKKQAGENVQTFTVKGRGFSVDGVKQDFSFSEEIAGQIDDETAKE